MVMTQFRRWGEGEAWTWCGLLSQGYGLSQPWVRMRKWDRPPGNPTGYWAQGVREATATTFPLEPLSSRHPLPGAAGNISHIPKAGWAGSSSESEEGALPLSWKDLLVCREQALGSLPICG